MKAKERKAKEGEVRREGEKGESKEEICKCTESNGQKKGEDKNKIN